MEAGKSIGGRRAAAGWSRSVTLTSPLRAVWWLFTNVRFAILLLAVLSAISLLGVLLPQAPLNVRGDSVAEAAWLESQEGRFGPATEVIDRLGLFGVFHARWFAILLAVTAVSTGAYVVSRSTGVWRSITKPRKRVPDRYFTMAPNRAYVSSPVDVPQLEAALRKARYRVERFEEGAATYLFADRFQWAQLGSLLTHIAVIVFILSAVVSRVDAFSSPLFLAEGSTLPVFPVKDREQMQVRLVDAHAAFAPDGQPLDYRSEMVIYDRGEEALRCSSTVNSPCGYRGYRFYQSAYFGFGAAVEVRDMSTGNVIYRETLALADKQPSPRLAVRDQDGRVLLDEAIVLPETAVAGGKTYRAALVELSVGRTLTLWLPEDGGGELLVFEPSASADAVRLALKPGEEAESGGLTVTYARRDTVPSGIVPDLPLPGSRGDAMPARMTLANVVYGSERASAGTEAEGTPAEKAPELTITGIRPAAVSLSPGESVTVDGYEYRFLGQREFSGIQVRRDRSDYLVWIGAGLIVFGLMITFWMPRRRFWAKITQTETCLAGQAPSHSDYNRELRRLARQAGAGTGNTDDDDD